SPALGANIDGALQCDHDFAAVAEHGMRTYALRCAPSIEGQAFELAEAHDRVALAVESRGAVVAAGDDGRFELDLRRHAIFGANRANLLDRGFHAREFAIGHGIFQLTADRGPGSNREQLIRARKPRS